MLCLCKKIVTMIDKYGLVAGFSGRECVKSEERIGVMGETKQQKHINDDSKKKETKPEKSEAKAGAAEIEEIKEFVVSSEKERSERKKAEQASVSAIAAWSSRKKSIAVLILFVAVAIADVLIGILACKVNPVVVCVVLLIQVAIGVLLDQNPIWLHACVVAADVIAGICVSQILLMAVAAVVYIAAIATLEVLQRMGYAPVKKEA